MDLLIRISCQTLPKALDLSGARAWVAQDLLKAQAILSDKTVGRPAVGREDLYQSLLFTNFSKILLTTESGLTGWKFLALELSPTFLPRPQMRYKLKVMSATFIRSYT